VITSSGGAHSAPSGFGGASPSRAFSSGANMVNAIHWPSGDHSRLPGASVSSASRAVWPVCIQRTKSCGRPPSAVETYAMRSAFGDQRGAECEPAPVTSGVCAPDSVSTSQIVCLPRSVMMSYDTRT
jgi:hypothetical protein